jgi:aspartyl-tRNA(Asn)/glutamyl-tRNA(Gln) amidotransferase subunit B
MSSIYDEYEMVCGLEVHVQLKTNTKMFCGCRNEYGAPPNTHTCPVCLGMPGPLPVPNIEAIRMIIQTGLMLGCRIGEVCKFDRKSYFYPDMPKNYQITQYDLPFCIGGGVTLDKYAFPKETQKEPIADAKKVIRLVRIHLEEDVAKSFHFDAASGIDFNRAGTPLMEIVSEADLASAEEAFAYLTNLKQILIYGGVSDADMEKGQLRCDVNISVRKKGVTTFGTKCELKNLNSISGVRRAIDFEKKRQIDVITQGGTIRQETRRWDDPSGQTYLMRIKEQAHDYRYFPEPDLLPVRTDRGLKAEAEARMPELPQAKKERLVRDFSLTDYQAEVIAADKRLSDYYEKAAAITAHKASVANFLINDFLATEPDLDTLVIPAVHFGQLAELAGSGKINSKQAKDVFTAMIESGDEPDALVTKLGLSQISDPAQLGPWCDEAIAANAKAVGEFKSGKDNAINSLKGFVMKQSKGKANPVLVDQILREKLAS